MFELVLAWAKENVDPKKPRIEDLTEQVDLEASLFNLHVDQKMIMFNV